MDHQFETDKWPFLEARHFKHITEKRKVRVIVMHDMEAPENSSTAENVAKYFHTTPTPASAHICVDNDSIVQCVLDNDVAYAAPGANNDGIQIEMAGFAKQTREQWLDPYGVLLLDRSADAAAQYCLKYDIPVRQLTNQQLANGEKGIVGHRQVSQVYKKSDHMDPGTNFPWDYFLERVNRHYVERAKKFGKVPVGTPGVPAGV